MPKRTAKSCGPDSLWVGVKFALRSAGDGDKQILIAGETTYKP